MMRKLINNVLYVANPPLSQKIGKQPLYKHASYGNRFDVISCREVTKEV